MKEAIFVASEKLGRVVLFCTVIKWDINDELVAISVIRYKVICHY